MLWNAVCKTRHGCYTLDLMTNVHPQRTGATLSPSPFFYRKGGIQNVPSINGRWGNVLGKTHYYT